MRVSSAACFGVDGRIRRLYFLLFFTNTIVPQVCLIFVKINEHALCAYTYEINTSTYILSTFDCANVLLIYISPYLHQRAPKHIAGAASASQKGPTPAPAQQPRNISSSQVCLHTRSPTSMHLKRTHTRAHSRHMTHTHTQLPHY